MRWIALALLAGILFVVVGAACTDEEGEDVENVPTATAEEAADTPPPPESTDTPATNAAPSTYEIAEREDASFREVVRIIYRVGVSGPITKEELRSIAQEIIDDETAQQDVNAIGFVFQMPETDNTGVVVIGNADWAPDGDWKSADTVQAGDYSRHELRVKYIFIP